MVAAEASAAGFAEVREVPGGVELVGSPLRANRMLATPTRILLRVAQFRAPTFEDLEKQAARVDWRRFGGLTPEATAHKSRLYHTGAIEERLARVVPQGPGALLARFDQDVCTLSVDTSGELLHKRGWRLESGPAPLRETLAAALLCLADWRPGESLYDPMCGSGTFLIEAATRAAGLWPGRLRTFACEAWSAREPQPPPRAPVPTVIAGSDRSASAVRAAQRNAERAGVDVPLRALEAAHAVPPEGPAGLVICNPPYGQRIDTGHALGRLATMLGGPFRGWRAAVLLPDPRELGALKRPITARHAVINGGLRLTFAVLA